MSLLKMLWANFKKAAMMDAQSCQPSPTVIYPPTRANASICKVTPFINGKSHSMPW